MLLEGGIIDRNKIKADNYISVLIIASFLLFASLFNLEAVLSVIVYPFACLAIYGVLIIIGALNKRNNPTHGRLNKILLGIIFIIFSILFLWFFLSQPNVTSHRIIALITFPMIIVACAGIIKGYIIKIYSLKQRIMNIIIGFITFIINLLVLFNILNNFLFNILNNFLFNIVVLSLTLLINIFSRAALYLSEYGLSLFHLRNFKLFLYIISDYLVYVDRNGNLELSKL